jgi:hypothetical protein
MGGPAALWPWRFQALVLIRLVAILRHGCGGVTDSNPRPEKPTNGILESPLLGAAVAIGPSRRRPSTKGLPISLTWGRAQIPT